MKKILQCGLYALMISGFVEANAADQLRPEGASSLSAQSAATSPVESILGNLEVVTAGCTAIYWPFYGGRKETNDLLTEFANTLCKCSEAQYNELLSALNDILEGRRELNEEKYHEALRRELTLPDATQEYIKKIARSARMFGHKEKGYWIFGVDTSKFKKDIYIKTLKDGGRVVGYHFDSQDLHVDSQDLHEIVCGFYDIEKGLGDSSIISGWQRSTIANISNLVKFFSIWQRFASAYSTVFEKGNSGDRAALATLYEGIISDPFEKVCNSYSNPFGRVGNSYVDDFLRLYFHVGNGVRFQLEKLRQCKKDVTCGSKITINSEWMQSWAQLKKILESNSSISEFQDAVTADCDVYMSCNTGSVETINSLLEWGGRINKLYIGASADVPNALEKIHFNKSRVRSLRLDWRECGALTISPQIVGRLRKLASLTTLELYNAQIVDVEGFFNFLTDSKVKEVNFLDVDPFGGQSYLKSAILFQRCNIEEFKYASTTGDGLAKIGLLSHYFPKSLKRLALYCKDQDILFETCKTVLSVNRFITDFRISVDKDMVAREFCYRQCVYGGGNGIIDKSIAYYCAIHPSLSCLDFDNSWGWSFDNESLESRLKQAVKFMIPMAPKDYKSRLFELLRGCCKFNENFGGLASKVIRHITEIIANFLELERVYMWAVKGLPNGGGCDCFWQAFPKTMFGLTEVLEDISSRCLDGVTAWREIVEKNGEEMEKAQSTEEIESMIENASSLMSFLDEDKKKTINDCRGRIAKWREDFTSEVWRLKPFNCTETAESADVKSKIDLLKAQLDSLNRQIHSMQQQIKEVRSSSEGAKPNNSFVGGVYAGFMTLINKGQAPKLEKANEEQERAVKLQFKELQTQLEKLEKRQKEIERVESDGRKEIERIESKTKAFGPRCPLINEVMQELDALIAYMYSAVQTKLRSSIETARQKAATMAIEKWKKR